MLLIASWLSIMALLKLRSASVILFIISVVLSFIDNWLSIMALLKLRSASVILLRMDVLLLFIFMVVCAWIILKLLSSVISLSIIAFWLSVIFPIKLLSNNSVLPPWLDATVMIDSCKALINASLDAILLSEEVWKEFVIASVNDEILLSIELTVFWPVVLIEFSVLVAKSEIFVVIALIVLLLLVLIAWLVAVVSCDILSSKRLLVPCKIVSNSSWLVSDNALLLLIVPIKDPSCCVTLKILPVICVTWVSLRPPPPPPPEEPESNLFVLPIY